MDLVKIPTSYSIKFLLDVIYRQWNIDECSFAKYSVPIHLIENTQETLYPHGIDEYANCKRLPAANGIRFKGDRRVFLTDGHHRLYAAKLQQRKTFRVTVFNLPFSLIEAKLNCHIRYED